MSTKLTLSQPKGLIKDCLVSTYMKKFPVSIHCRFSEDTIKKIDKLIDNNKFDDYPSLIRRAVNDFLEKMDKPVYA